MLNTIFILDDEYMIDRFSKVFTRDNEYEFAFFYNANEAVEYLRINSVDIAFLSVNLGIMNGEELAEMIYDINPKCRFIFAFRDNDVEEAIALFNYYDYCHLIEHLSLEPENIKDYLNGIKEEIKTEAGYKLRSKEFREKEKSYKKKMAEMSSILNVRLSCYSKLVLLLSCGINKLFDNTDQASFSKVTSFFEHELNEYIRFFLDRPVDYEDLFEALSGKYHDASNRKFFVSKKQFESDDEINNLRVIFIMQLICDSFFTFMEAYRGKVDIIEDDNYIKMDVIFDIRAGHQDSVSWEYCCMILNNIIESFSYKLTKASRDGIMQYRIYFDKNSNNLETA